MPSERPTGYNVPIPYETDLRDLLHDASTHLDDTGMHEMARAVRQAVEQMTTHAQLLETATRLQERRLAESLTGAKESTVDPLQGCTEVHFGMYRAFALDGAREAGAIWRVTAAFTMTERFRLFLRDKGLLTRDQAISMARELDHEDQKPT